MILGPLAMGLLLMVDPWAKHVDFSGGAVFELRGGLAPPRPSDPSEPALWLSLSPQGTITYQDRVRSRELSFDYSPQLFLRVSEGILASSQVPGRPLFFHRATLRHSADLDRRWSWQGSAGASIGEQDYSLQSGGLVQGDGSTGNGTVGPGQGTLLDDPVIVTGGLAMGVGVTGRLTPLHSITFGPSLGIQRLLSDPPASGGNVISFDQTSGQLDVSHAWLASRVDTVTTAAAGGYADFGPVNGSQAYGSASLAWRRRLRPRLDSELLGGVFITQQVNERQDANTATLAAQPVPIMPITNASLSGRLLERSRVRVSTVVDVGNRAYFDPVQGSVLPLSGGGTSLTVFLPPDLTLALAASFYTPPVRPTDFEHRYANDPSTARTALTLRTPISYVIDRHFSVEAGTIVTARGPNVRTGIPRISEIQAPATIDDIDLEDISFAPWRFTQTEFWVYVAFRMRYTSSRAEGNRVGGGGSTVTGD